MGMPSWRARRGSLALHSDQTSPRLGIRQGQPLVQIVALSFIIAQRVDQDDLDRGQRLDDLRLAPRGDQGALRVRVSLRDLSDGRQSIDLPRANTALKLESIRDEIVGDDLQALALWLRQVRVVHVAQLRPRAVQRQLFPLERRAQVGERARQIGQSPVEVRRPRLAQEFLQLHRHHRADRGSHERLDERGAFAEVTGQGVTRFQGGQRLVQLPLGHLQAGANGEEQAELPHALKVGDQEVDALFAQPLRQLPVAVFAACGPIHLAQSVEIQQPVEIAIFQPTDGSARRRFDLLHHLALAEVGPPLGTEGPIVKQGGVARRLFGQFGQQQIFQGRHRLRGRRQHQLDRLGCLCGGWGRDSEQKEEHQESFHKGPPGWSRAERR